MDTICMVALIVDVALLVYVIINGYGNDEAK